MSGRVWLMYDRVAVGKKRRVQQLVELCRKIRAMGTIGQWEPTVSSLPDVT